MTADLGEDSLQQLPPGAIDQFRRRIGAMNAAALLADSARSALGLRHVSEVWDHRPRWYYWLSQPQGAFAIELDAGWTDARSGATVGLFSLRYYPAACDGAYFLSSPAERCALTSGWFDATGTPAFEARSQVPAALFTVGTLEFHVAPDEDRALLLLMGLDRCRTRTPDGRLLRDIPGWRLSRAFFDSFVGMQALFARTSPRRVVLGTRAGFELVEGEAVAVRDVPERPLLGLAVEFGGDAESPALLDDAAGLGKVVLDTRASPRRDGLRRPERRTRGSLPDYWWTISDEPHMVGHLPCSCCGPIAWRRVHAGQREARLTCM
jgi:hypothetical protein